MSGRTTLSIGPWWHLYGDWPYDDRLFLELCHLELGLHAKPNGVTNVALTLDKEAAVELFGKLYAATRKYEVPKKGELTTAFIQMAIAHGLVWRCTAQNPWPGKADWPGEHVHPSASEVPDSQEDCGLGCNTVRMKCPICNFGWTKELAQ